MKKKCATCKQVFDALRAANTCSPECKRERTRVLKRERYKCVAKKQRALRHAREHAREVLKDPVKRKQNCARMRTWLSDPANKERNLIRARARSVDPGKQEHIKEKKREWYKLLRNLLKK